MRQFGIIEPSGNDKAWWIGAGHLLELTTAMRSLVSLRIRGGNPKKKKKGRRYTSAPQSSPPASHAGPR
ncbi:hypothetical protein BMW22_08365 [Rhizobium leguminosarum]|uniref:Uncharacterized protein n=1 Tax=Rhizobium leguminosarum TaxID=384 RepID=A0A1L3Z7J2_RHILE|nr:hypothetical protein BMW22_08365 [Rhizobium leguminosarum]